MINPFVQALAPRLLWHDQAAGWDVLALKQRLAAVSDKWACHRLGARSAVYFS